MEKSRTADQLSHPALALIAARPDLFSRQGYLTATFRCRNGKRFGPYCLLNYREQGRLRSIYLGRPGALVEQAVAVGCVLARTLRKTIHATRGLTNRLPLSTLVGLG